MLHLTQLSGFGDIAPARFDVFDLDFIGGATPTGLSNAGFTFARSGNAWDDFGVLSASGARINTTFGLLMEPAETASNVLQNSDSLTNATWSAGNLTVTGTQSDPAGGTSAGLLTDNGTNGTHTLSRSAIKATGDCMLTAFAKAGTLSRVKLRDAQGTVSEATFLLSGAGSLVSSANVLKTFIFAVGGGGWYRIGMLYNNASGSSNARGIRLVNNSALDSYAGTSQTLTMFRMMVSAAGTVGMSTPIAITTTNTTRNVETCVATRTAIARGSVLIKARAPLTTDADDRVVYALDDGTANNRIVVIRDTSKVLRVIVTSGGSQLANLNLGTANDNTVFKVGLAFQSGDFIAKSDLGSDQVASVAVPSGLTKECVGHQSAGNTWGRTIERVGRADMRLGNVDLQNLLNAA